MLDLNYQKLKAEDIEKLCKALAKNTYIKVLSVGSNQMGAAGAQVFAASKTLVSLKIWGNPALTHQLQKTLQFLYEQ